MGLGVLLDVSLSVLAVMVLFSLVASAINEFIADNLLNLRGRKLREVIRRQFEVALKLAPAAAEERADAFFRHPEISRGMEAASVMARRLPGRIGVNGRSLRLPSAIEPRQYALAMLEFLDDPGRLAARAGAEIDAARAAVLEVVAAGGELAGADEVSRRLTERIGAAFDAARERVSAGGARAEAAIAGLEAEFADLMARASGWYLRSTRTALFCIGLVLAAGANVDLLRYAQRLMTEASAGTRVEIAQTLVEDAMASPAAEDDVRAYLTGLFQQLEQLDVQVGWQCLSGEAAGQTCALEWPSLSKLGCWLLIAFGVTLGAQFWFDLFKKLVDLRSAGQVADPAPNPTELPDKPA